MSLLFLVVLICLTMWPAPPVTADSTPDASDPPRTSGPLVGSPLGCEDDGPSGPWEFKAQSCSWLYELAPAETNLEKDFAAYWVQMEITPGKGLCAKDLGFNLTRPRGVRIISAVPRHGGRVAEHRSAVTELLVDADGDAPIPGTVSQDVLLAPGRIKVNKSARHYSFRWSGNSPRKVVIAIGIQLAHDRIHPSMFSGWIEGIMFGGGPCRPLTAFER